MPLSVIYRRFRQRLRRISPLGGRFRAVFRPHRKKIGALLIIIAIALILPTLFIGNYMRDLVAHAAARTASDMVTAVVNSVVNDLMLEGVYDYGYFVSIHKDSTGSASVISANVARINLLSTEILNRIIASAASGEISFSIPFGNLIASPLFTGRGPGIPVKISTVTSTGAEFRNEISAAGINQVRHQIILDVHVGFDVLIPWDIESMEVLTEVLIAETIIVGRVPDTYVHFQGALEVPRG